MDAGSELYVTGSTESLDFPVHLPFQPSSGGAPDAFVAKIAADGSSFRYSSYLGGTARQPPQPETGTSIAVDGTGSAWVAGTTSSLAFPLAAAFQSTYGGGNSDAFLARISADGSSLLFSTYAGGNGTDQAPVVALGQDQVWLAGSTTSTDLPLTGQIYGASVSSWDGFVTAYNYPLTARTFSTYLSGSGSDTITAAVAVGTSLYVAGNSSSVSYLPTGWPKGLIDGYLARLDAAPAVLQITPSNGTAQYTLSGVGCEPGTYTGVKVFAWQSGATCSIAVPTPQTSGGSRLVFTGWSDGSTANPRSVVASAPSSQLFPNFATEVLITRTVAPASAGVILSNPDPPGGWYVQNATVTLTAQPASGFRFVNWTGTVASTATSVVVNAWAPQTVTANFACQYSLGASVLNIGQAGGTESPSLTAGAGCTWTPVSNASWITVTHTGPGSGSGSFAISVAPNTGSARSATVSVGGITLTVQQTAVSTFPTTIQGVNWTVSGSGCEAGTYTGQRTLNWTGNAQCTVTMNSVSGSDTRQVLSKWHDNVTATTRSFVANGAASYTATYRTEYRIVASATGGGSAAPAESWIAAGSSVTLTASAAPGYTFVGWTGSITASANPLQLQASSPLTLTAGFSGATVPVTVDGRSWTVAGSGCAPGSYSGSKTLSWITGAQCTVTMHTVQGSDTRHVFTQWSDGSTSPTRVLTAAASTSYAASYRTEFRVLAINVGNGAVAPQESWHPAGAAVTLTATAASGHRFNKWSGEVTTTANPLKATISGPLTVNALFARNCTFSIAPASRTVPWQGAKGTFVLSGAACEWEAASSATWLDLFPLNGSAGGEIAYTVYPNMSGATRTAQISIGTATFSVTQLPSGLSNHRRYLQTLYFNFMNRLPSDAEAAGWEAHLNGGLPRHLIAEAFLNSPEFAIGGKYVAGLYVGLLNRDAEYTGWLFIRGAMISGVVSPDSMVDNFINSAEFHLQNGELSDAGYIALLYRQALGRTGGSGEIAGWVNTMRSPPNNRVVVGRSFLRSEEFQKGSGSRLTTFLLYAALLARDPSSTERAQMLDRIAAGVPVSTLIAELINSAEFNALLN